MVAAGWPSAALDNKPDKDKRIVRLTLAHVRFIIRSPEPRKAVGRARGIVVSTIETIIQQHFADFFYSVRKPNLLKNMGLMTRLGYSTRRSARLRAATH
jgi:hypothetical protein